MSVSCIRVHDLVSGRADTDADADAGDAYVVLVDRLWPRGVRKDAFRHDEWCRDVAPSDELRRQFHGGDVGFDAFVERYRAELSLPPAAAAVRRLAARAEDEDVVLAYASRDTERNHAKVLADVIRGTDT